MLQRNNVLLMDEPTNHLDMESIESLNAALEKYTGTLIFVSHDREFVSSLATRIVEMKPEGVVDFKGNYEDYLRSQGIFSDSVNSRGNSSASAKEKARASSR
jgi:ATPase subunit of ABC transporter with duplicated ATPase domains